MNSFNQEVRTQKLIDAKSATFTSEPVALPPGKKLFHIVMASGTATQKIDGSNDGSNWVELHSEATSSTAANTAIELDDVFAKHRARVSAWTSGVQNCTVSYAQAK